MKFSRFVTVPNRAAIKLQAHMLSSLHRQKGATALEYLVLAAAVIVILGVLATNDGVQGAITTAFTDLFGEAADTSN